MGDTENEEGKRRKIEREREQEVGIAREFSLEN